MKRLLTEESYEIVRYLIEPTYGRKMFELLTISGSGYDEALMAV